MSAAESNNTPRYSSSPELSSPPRSPSDPDSPAAQQLTNEYRNAQSSNTITVNFGVDDVNVAAAPPPVRKKPGRKPGSTNKPKPPPGEGNSAPNVDAPKTRKPRKPREVKDPNSAPVQRKKKSITADSEPAKVAPVVAARQLKINEMSAQQNDTNINVPSDATTAATTPLGKIEDIPNSAPPVSNSFFNSAPPQPPPQTLQSAPIRTSGQNYDPIRSKYDAVRETVVNHNTFNAAQMSPKTTQMVNRASASPSISSLVDPPNQSSTSPSMAQQSFFSHQLKMQVQERPVSVPPSPTGNRLAPSPMLTATQIVSQETTGQPAQEWVRAHAPAPTFASSPAPQPGNFSTIQRKASNPGGSTAVSSAAPSPKPSKLVDVTPPPLPGSGAISMFGNGPKDGTESRAPTIVLNIPMNGETNKYINFTRLAEERYGWEALHPRLAAQRERLARVAAAGAALEKTSMNKESGDEMSLDMSEGEGSNVEMGGMSDGRTGTDGAKKPIRKRKMKEDEYDKDDGFVDDTELLWEEQAAASKDGFFVYSGPLVPEGEKPSLDRADGAPKRGRGRGRGGSTRGTTGGGPGSRGGGTAGGPGSRGGNTTRKPRITKADRARMEQEKREREQLGSLAAKPNGYSGMSQLASAAALGGTPMTFN